MSIDEFIPSKTKIVPQKFLVMTIAQKFRISITIGQTSQLMVEINVARQKKGEKEGKH